MVLFLICHMHTKLRGPQSLGPLQVCARARTCGPSCSSTPAFPKHVPFQSHFSMLLKICYCWNTFPRTMQSVSKCCCYYSVFFYLTEVLGFVKTAQCIPRSILKKIFCGFWLQGGDLFRREGTVAELPMSNTQKTLQEKVQSSANRFYMRHVLKPNHQSNRFFTLDKTLPFF